MATLTNLISSTYSFSTTPSIFSSVSRNIKSFAVGLVVSYNAVEVKTHTQLLAKYLPSYLRSKITIT